MKSFSITLLLALLLQQQSQGFVSSFLTTARRNIKAPLIVAEGPLFISTTELTAEAHSTNDDTATEEKGQEESSSSVEIPVVQDSSAEEETAAAAVAVEEEQEEEEEEATSATLTADQQEETPSPVSEALKEEIVRHTLFIGNVPFEMTEDTINTMAAEFGQVTKVVLPRDRESGKPRGFAFVDMATDEDMKAAMAGIDGRLDSGRVLRATPTLPKDKQAKKRGKSSDNTMAKVYVGNLAYTTTEEELAEHFKQYGLVFEVYVPRDNDGQARGYAFVTVKKEEIDSVIENANGSELNARALSVEMPTPKGSKAPRRARGPARTKIYVGNLSFYTSQEVLGEVFAEFGNVYDCYIPTDTTTGSSRGFGFVTMDPEDAQQAIAELDECELDGRFLRVNEAQAKSRPSFVQDEDSNEEDGNDSDNDSQF